LRSKHSYCSFFYHIYLEEEKSMIHVHSFTVTFGAKYLTSMVTSVPPYETFSLIKNNILYQSTLQKSLSREIMSWYIFVCNKSKVKAVFAVVPTDKICGRSSSPNIPVDMNCILMKLYVTYCGLSKHSDR
jgi:hypothetical protein